jgi:hypothetical protein
MILISKIPVTPAIVRGCAPKTEKMNAAMNEANNTSVTPYCSVVSIRSREKAIPGRTLRHNQSQRVYVFLRRLQNSLGKESKSSGRDNAVVPRVCPITTIPWSPCAYVGYDPCSKASKVEKLYWSCLRFGGRCSS